MTNTGTKEIYSMFNFFKKWQNSPTTSQPTLPETVAGLSLYYFPSCPYCRIVLKQLNRMNLDIELRNIHEKDSFKKELIAGGGKKTVPCLRIENEQKHTTWMYESMDIVTFLQKMKSS